MKNGLMIVFSLLGILLWAGCEPTYPIEYEHLPIHPSKRLTLPADQLVQLDWHSPHRRGGRIESIQPTDGAGVLFNIDFPSNNPGDNEVTYVSSGEGGMGLLVGMDVNGYETFALKFTLVSINGTAAAPELDKQLTVGAVVGPTAGRIMAYDAKTLSLNGTEKNAVSTTLMRTRELYQIGFLANIKNPKAWGEKPNKVVLLVEPVENAGPVPQPEIIEDNKIRIY
ncbi:MAG: hypothetical protein ACYSUT_04765 [Planctomycetota bacterium]|jgi:hypothetical protein